jgi:hypothetical protein
VDLSTSSWARDLTSFLLRKPSLSPQMAFISLKAMQGLRLGYRFVEGGQGETGYHNTYTHTYTPLQR